MADSVVAESPADDMVTKQTFEEQKRLAEQKTQEAAAAQAELERYRVADRDKLKSFADMNREFLKTNAELAPAEARPHFNAMMEWAEKAHELPNLPQQLQLGTVVSCCASNLKRVREDASVQSVAAQQLGQTQKQLEEVTADRDLKERRIGELSKSLEEMQSSTAVLEKKLVEAGLLSQKFDFSKASSREEAVEPKATEPELAVETSNASRGAAAMANPASALLAFVGSARGGASARFQPTNSNHSLLGAPTNESSFTFLPM